MRIAITGGTGFIGKKLVQYHLQQGDFVHLLTRKLTIDFQHNNLKIFNGDLLDDSISFAEFLDDINVLYHCAAEISDLDKIWNVNVSSTQKLISASRNKIIRWVQLSSCGVYGNVRAGLVDETYLKNPIGLYEQSKSVAEELLITANKAGFFELVLLRPSNVYGESMTNKSLFQLFSAVKKGIYFHLGFDQASANYIHVDDVVNALGLCATNVNANGKIYNVSDYQTFDSLIFEVSKVLGVRNPSLRIPLLFIRILVNLLEFIPNFPLTSSRINALTSKVIFSNKKIENDLGFKHLVSPSDGIKRLVRYWSNMR